MWKHVFENVKDFASEDVKLLHTNNPYGETIEGGDICILSPEVIAIGHSCRTLPQAIEQFAKATLASGDSFKKVVVSKFRRAAPTCIWTRCLPRLMWISSPFILAL